MRLVVLLAVLLAVRLAVRLRCVWRASPGRAHVRARKRGSGRGHDGLGQRAPVPEESGRGRRPRRGRRVEVEVAAPAGAGAATGAATRALARRVPARSNSEPGGRSALEGVKKRERQKCLQRNPKDFRPSCPSQMVRARGPRRERFGARIRTNQSSKSARMQRYPDDFKSACLPTDLNDSIRIKGTADASAEKWNGMAGWPAPSHPSLVVQALRGQGCRPLAHVGRRGRL